MGNNGDLRVELVHLARAYMPITEVHSAPGAPLGTRVFGGVVGRWEGERLNAAVLSPSADFAVGGQTSVHLALKADDGATIFVSYNGRGRSDGALFAGMTFEAGNEYAWLNGVVAIARGTVHPPDAEHTLGVVEYQVYEVV